MKNKICENCKRAIDRELLRKEGKTVNCLYFNCNQLHGHCDTVDLFHYLYSCIQPERLNPETPKGDAIV